MTKNEDLKAHEMPHEIELGYFYIGAPMSEHFYSVIDKEMEEKGMKPIARARYTRPTVTDRRKNKRCEGRNACGGCYPAVCLETDGYERAREVVHKSPTDTAMEDASGFKAPILNSRMVPKNKAQQSASSTTDGDAERYFNLMIAAFFTNPHLLSVWEKEIKTIRTALHSTRKPSVAMHCQLDKKCFVHCGADCDCMPIDVLLPPVDTIAVPREVLQMVREALKEYTAFKEEPPDFGYRYNLGIKALASLDAVLSEGKS